MHGGAWKQGVMVVWKSRLQMEQEQNTRAEKSVSRRWGSSSWLWYRQVRFLKSGPSHPLPNYKAGLSARLHVWARQLEHLLSCRDIQPVRSFPTRENPPSAPCDDLIPNTCCTCLKCPLSLGFLFSFLFFFKVKPTNLKCFESRLSAICEDATSHPQAEWSLVQQKLYRCPSEGKSDFPFSGLTGSLPTH